jgi:phage-related tail fiber protein
MADSSYPEDIVSWSDKADITDDIFASYVNNLYAETIAIETELTANVNKQPVKAATTANITLSGTQTIDGISVIADDRVLVKDQTSASENGIYVCAAGAWSRATDSDSSDKVKTGMRTYVSQGTTNGGGLYELTTTGTITLDTTELTFEDRLATHKSDNMPHQFAGESKTYKYGFRRQDDRLVFSYEEVV